MTITDSPLRLDRDDWRRDDWSRLIARQVSELALARCIRWRQTVGRDTLDSILVAIVISASISHLPHRAPEGDGWLGWDIALTSARPVSAGAIADSMRLPATTIRRRVADLVEAGLLARQAGGYTLAVGSAAVHVMATVASGGRDDLGRMIAALAQAGYPPTVAMQGLDISTASPNVVERLLLKFQLRVTESLARFPGDLDTALILMAIVAVNVRHITGDPVLARRYAADANPPPDHERRPVTLRALARHVELPFETVRRRTAALLERGGIVAKEGGVIVPTEVLMRDNHRADNRAMIADFEMMLASLALTLDAAGDGRQRPDGT